MPKALKLEINIREKEVLRYLKFDLGKTKADASIIRLVREQIKAGDSLVIPGLKFKIFDILANDGKKIKLPDLIIGNKSIARLLKDAEKAVVFVTTIGTDLELEITRLFSAGEPTRAVILDAVGSEAVEVLTDAAQISITQQAGPYQSTPRFSPGYGDWPLKVNKTILELLGAKALGIRVSSQYMLSPQKTVTGIWGLVRKEESS
ncbi:MAG: hypothetical protein PHV60_06970 [bacterium]|nr:hypothetical protein [bacterium]